MRVRRNLKCVQFNVCVGNTVDTNLETKCAKLELGITTFKPAKKKHPKEFDKNAKQYENMNRPKVINRVFANNLLLNSIKEFLEEI